MNDKLRVHVEELFRNAPDTNLINEIREELLANLNDKYEDLLSQGKNREEALAATVSNIGDIERLIKDLSTVEELKITDLLMKMATRYSNQNTIGGQIIDRVISGLRKLVPLAVGSLLLWNSVLAFYFTWSIFFCAWRISWVTFIAGAVLQVVAIIIFAKKMKRIVIFLIVYLAAALIYLMLGFGFDLWDRTWMIFLFATVAQQSIWFYRIMKNK